MKDLNFDEIQQYFKELDDKPQVKVTKARIYGMARTYDEIIEKEKPIREYLKDRKWDVQEIYFVGEEIQIAKYKERTTDEIHYYIFINNKSASCIEDSFDAALLVALCHKYNCPGATQYIAKMIGMFEPAKAL